MLHSRGNLADVVIRAAQPSDPVTTSRDSLLQPFFEAYTHPGRSIPAFPTIYNLPTAFSALQLTLHCHLVHQQFTTILDYIPSYCILIVYQSLMSEEYEMDDTTAGATAAGTAADDPPSRQRSDQDRRPSVPGRFSPSIQTSGYYNREKVSLKDALAQISPSELDAVPTSTDSVEDFDELLASLESDDEKEVSVEDEIRTVGEARAIPSVLLETSPNHGLDDAEVLSRRKRYGWNMMKEEKRSHLKTFLMFFVGPIQCVMLVSRGPFPSN